MDKAKRGRPRAFAAIEVRRSETEARVADAVLARAMREGTSYETAFSRCLVDGTLKAAFDGTLKTAFTESSAEVDGSEPAAMLTPLAASKAWQVDIRTLMRWVKAGRIYGKKTSSGGWHIPADQPEAIQALQRYDWIRQGKDAPAETPPKAEALGQDKSETFRWARARLERLRAVMGATR